MKTVAEVLKETGLTDEQISALDPKLVTGVTTILSTAQQAQEKAELAQRATNEKFETEISPALDAWANDKAALAAKMAAYDAALKAAEEGGFKIPDILKAPIAAAVTPPRTADGKFVAGSTGSPEFVQGLKNEVGAAFGFVADTTWKYRTLYGTEMPDSPTTIIREATAQRLDPAVYAAKKYDFAGKEAAKRAEEQKKHDDAITAAAIAENDKKWAERVGSNPNIRQAEASKFSVLQKAVDAKERPSPLGLTREERHRNTSQAIQKEIAENATVQ
jgi:hypothetical protein